MNQRKYGTYDTIHIRLIDSTSFEIEETLDFKLASTPPKLNRRTRRPEEKSNVFFDPNGEMMYVERYGTLYEWKMRAKEGPEWWLGEE